MGRGGEWGWGGGNREEGMGRRGEGWRLMTLLSLCKTLYLSRM